MVALILFLFLLNVRTTLISLTAIPLSLAVTLAVFHALDQSITARDPGRAGPSPLASWWTTRWWTWKTCCAG